MKIKSYSIRIEQDLLHKLHYMAAYDGRSANSQVLYYIKQAVTAFEKKNGPIEIAENKIGYMYYTEEKRLNHSIAFLHLLLFFCNNSALIFHSF